MANEPKGKAWLGAFNLFKTGEVKGLGGTCLGYSRNSTKGGNGIGPVLAAKALRWAKDVLELGVKDPELFSSLSLFEEGIGADRISDMVASITADCIIAFNQRVLSEMIAEQNPKLQLVDAHIAGRTSKLALNPFSGEPILLLASDILKHLPIMNDVLSLQPIAESNDEIRLRVNNHIGEIFKIRTKAEKEHIKKLAMQDAESFQTLLDLLKLLEKTPYDMASDPQGLIQWRSNAHKFADLHKLKIVDDETKPELERIEKIVSLIIAQFKVLVEDNRLNRTFFVDNEPRHERYAQLLFIAIARSYCDANGIDMAPESDNGAGPVDFKFSNGREKVLVEIKLSTNTSIVSGYKKQLEAYEKAELTQNSHYVVIDVGRMGNMWTRLSAYAAANPQISKLRKIHLIKGQLRPSASKL